MDVSLYPTKPLLLIDDEPEWLNSFAFSLDYNGGINNYLKCSDSRNALDMLANHDIDIVLLDLTMPNLSGYELLPLIVQHHPEIVVIIMSGMNQIQTAVKCLKSGAFDYFVKTDEKEHFINGIKKAIEHQQLKQENAALQQQVQQGGLTHPEMFSEIITQSRNMIGMFQYLEAIVGSGEPILITGESGVGKELVARAIHKLSGITKPMVSVNVAGLDDVNFSDVLFGHAIGAFTGAITVRDGMIETARDGILFLDEIGDLSEQSQIKLLRFLQEGEYFQLGSDVVKRSNAKVIFATNHNLAKRAEKGLFRADLYYRLCSHRVQIPPLRERLQDIPLLLDYFIGETCRVQKKQTPNIPKELHVLLSNYQFPGNIRELRSMIIDAITSHQGGILSMELFSRWIDTEENNGQTIETINAENGDSIWPFSSSRAIPTFAEASEVLMKEAMIRSKGNQGIAAKMLGISRQALNRRIKNNIAS